MNKKLWQKEDMKEEGALSEILLSDVFVCLFFGTEPRQNEAFLGNTLLKVKCTHLLFKYSHSVIKASRSSVCVVMATKILFLP